MNYILLQQLLPPEKFCWIGFNRFKDKIIPGTYFSLNLCLYCKFPYFPAPLVKLTACWLAWMLCFTCLSKQRQSVCLEIVLQNAISTTNSLELFLTLPRFGGPADLNRLHKMGKWNNNNNTNGTGCTPTVIIIISHCQKQNNIWRDTPGANISWQGHQSTLDWFCSQQLLPEPWILLHEPLLVVYMVTMQG